MRIGIVMQLTLLNPQSDIRNRKVADPPRLIAKTRCQMGQRENTAGVRWKMLMMKAILKTWPATPVEASLESKTSDIKLSRSCSLTEQPGSAGHLFGLWISDCRMRIGLVMQLSVFKSAIRNLHSAIAGAAL
jgi:hypothetical protein